MSDDDIDPELVDEVNKALAHGLQAEIIEQCRAKPPHIHLAHVDRKDMDDPPDNVGAVGVIVVGTVPDLSEADRAGAAAGFEAPCTELVENALAQGREWKEHVVNDNNGPCDLSPVMRVSWPTFAAVFDLGEYCDALGLEHPAAAIALVREAMTRPFGPPIGVELILDTWFYSPPRDDDRAERIAPGDAWRQRLPGAYEAMAATVATPAGFVQRYGLYVYGGGNVEWVNPEPLDEAQRWMPWGGESDTGASAGGRFVEVLSSMFGPARVPVIIRRNKRRRARDGTTE